MNGNPKQSFTLLSSVLSGLDENLLKPTTTRRVLNRHVSKNDQMFDLNNVMIIKICLAPTFMNLTFTNSGKCYQKWVYLLVVLPIFNCI